jgi:hypothetical protein
MDTGEKENLMQSTTQEYANELIGMFAQDD